ncbi:DinB family protein [Amycolatopsis benzoatilytica]|uniref:DinB family protein n=1 Tax=Amycolatopsis benzoatilytica TaxID=346045 RepID=UPI000364793B|nr:DinB family protein [Amycolatopsis benzoatilytica]
MTRTPKHLAKIAESDRPEIPRVADERTTLVAYLEWHRETLALKCANLSQAAVSSRAVPPSTMSLHGLVRHLAGCERWWFRIQFAGEEVPLLHYSDDDPDQDFDRLDGDFDEALQSWREECARSREILAAASSLDARGTSKMTGEPFSLRWMLVSMIAEYARHNGHADLLREVTDGATGR